MRREKASERQEKRSKGRTMSSFTAPSVVHEMRDHVMGVARTHGGRSVKSMIAHAAKKLGITPARAENYWYGEVRRVEAQEADQIRERAQLARLEALATLKRDYEAARREFISTAPRALAVLVPPALGDDEDPPPVAPDSRWRLTLALQEEARQRARRLWS